jgi:hypothetical protein
MLAAKESVFPCETGNAGRSLILCQVLCRDKLTKLDFESSTLALPVGKIAQSVLTLDLNSGRPFS